MSTKQRAYRRVWRTRSLAVLAVSQTAAALGFYVPVSALFLNSRGLSFSEIFWLESILLASILLTEVPAGVLSDRVDRRWVIVAGYVFNAIAETLFAVGQNFATFGVSFALSGLGIALLSGVEEAYVYESLGRDADDVAVGIFGHLSSLGITAGVVAALAGGVLASVDLALPAIITAVAAGLAAVIACFLTPRRPQHEEDENAPRAGQVGASVRLIFGSPVLLYVSVAASAGYVLFNAVYTLNQPLFARVGLPVSSWGALVGVALVIAAVCNHYADLIEKWLGRAWTLFIATAAGGVGFAVMAVPQVLAVVVGFFLVIVGMNARGPVMGAVANRLVESKQRATVLSVMSSLGSLIGIGINPIVGWGADRSPAASSVALGAVLVTMALAWLPIARRHLDVDQLESDESSTGQAAGHPPTVEDLPEPPLHR